MSKLLTAACAMVLLAGAAMAAETVRLVDWAVQPPRDKAVTVVPPRVEGFSAMARVANPSPQPRTFRLLALDKPGVAEATYAITGWVDYANVEGNAYLEMWSVFADGSRYFSRTLAERGPMRKWHGTAFHQFTLPFRGKPGMPPTRLEVNVVVPAHSTVLVGELELRQFEPDEDPLVWPGRVGAGMLVGTGAFMAGPLVGVLGALIGILASTGRFRRLVMALTVLGIVGGSLMVAIGIGFALLGRDPLGDDIGTGLWSPWLIAGVIAVAVFGGLRPVLRRRYDELELRRMQAMDTV